MLSPYLIAVLLAWITAQGAKFIIASLGRGSGVDFRKLYTSGNMPSAHSATVAALATVIGLIQGFGSGLFAISILFAAIVMYDAVMVRRSTGEQGVAIHALIKEKKSGVGLPRVALGHEPLEVVAGAFVGLVIGILVFFVTRY